MHPTYGITMNQAIFKNRVTLFASSSLEILICFQTWFKKLQFQSTRLDTYMSIQSLFDCDLSGSLGRCMYHLALPKLLMSHKSELGIAVFSYIVHLSHHPDYQLQFSYHWIKFVVFSEYLRVWGVQLQHS